LIFLDHIVDAQWIFGGIERNTNKRFMVTVPDSPVEETPFLYSFLFKRVKIMEFLEVSPKVKECHRIVCIPRQKLHRLKWGLLQVVAFDAHPKLALDNHLLKKWGHFLKFLKKLPAVQI
jgi:hypothetical protein